MYNLTIQMSTFSWLKQHLGNKTLQDYQIKGVYYGAGINFLFSVHVIFSYFSFQMRSIPVRSYWTH